MALSFSVRSSSFRGAEFFMHDAIALFTIRLILGIAWFCVLLADSRRGVVSPYFRIQMLLLLGLAALVGLAAPEAREKLFALALGGTAFVGSALWMLERRSAGRLAFLVIGVGAFLWMYAIVCVLSPTPGPHRMLLGASSLASAGTLGAAMSGMLLGHRYLTAPGMPIEPLHWANNNLGGAALVRLVFSAVALAFVGHAFTDSTYMVWLALRWLSGIAGPLAVWFMVRRILVYRNTQSATGVLFVGVILTFIGELTADILFRAVGIPF
jgi:hypothetical protein